MMTVKQTPNINANKVYTTLVGGMVVTSVLVLGSTTNYDAGNSKQAIYCSGKQTNIYTSFTRNDCISFDIPGYSNTKNVYSGVESVVINDEKLDNLKKLNMIASLENDWNGNGAKAFSSELISKVRNIITFLDIQPEVFPTACESVQLEYDKPDGAHMEIELKENEEAEIFLVDNAGCESLMSVNACVEAINEVVNNFYG